MSLLMEALKKAERAKQAAQEQGEQAAQEGGLQLAPEQTAAAAEEPAPAENPDSDAAISTPIGASQNPLLRDPRSGRLDFPRLELESIGDHEFELDPVKPRPSRTAQAAQAQGADDERNRAAARTVFEAKHADGASATPNRVPLLTGILLALLLLGGAGYWWVQKQFGTSNVVSPQILARGQIAPPPQLTRPVTGAPPATVAVQPGSQVVAIPATAAAPVSAAPVATPGIAPVAPPVIASETKTAESATEAPVQRRAKFVAAPARPSVRERPVAERREAAPGGFKVSPASLTANATLDRAYQAYLANDMTAARSGYGQVLANDAANRDALLGLAGVAARERRLDEAETLYLRVLRGDPSDAYAQTGLLAIRGQADPVASESRLKSLIAAQPNAAFLHYALGNLYARSGRWNEAQQEHFRATTLDADNPDYCYNLAVSLDQIRQPQLALTHYQRALTLAANRPASFDLSQLRARISELQK